MRNKKGQFIKGSHSKAEFKKGSKIGLNTCFKKDHKLGMTGNKHSKETKRKLSIINKGKKLSEETKRKISQNHRKCQTEETKQKIRLSKINNPNKIFKDTSIELKVEEELKRRNINYQKQVPLCKIAVVDFYLPEYRIIIQCDGCYWHNCFIHYPNYNQKQRKKDEKQDLVLTFNGFNVYRFWEHEINKSVEDCLDKIFYDN